VANGSQKKLLEFDDSPDHIVLGLQLGGNRLIPHNPTTLGVVGPALGAGLSLV